LSANFTRSKGGRMNIRVGESITHSANDFIKLSGSDTLTRRPNHIARVHSPGNCCFAIRAGWFTASSTQKEHNASCDPSLSQVHMCEKGITAFQSGIRQLIREFVSSRV